MKLLVQEQPHGALSVPQSRTVFQKIVIVCDRCYYIQPMKFQYSFSFSTYYSDLEESWILYPTQVQGAENSPVIERYWKSTWSVVYSAKHNSQWTMVVNAVQLLLYWTKKTTTISTPAIVDVKVFYHLCINCVLNSPKIPKIMQDVAGLNPRCVTCNVSALPLSHWACCKTSKNPYLCRQPDE